jgi:hypothetical protein
MKRTTSWTVAAFLIAFALAGLTVIFFSSCDSGSHHFESEAKPLSPSAPGPTTQSSIPELTNLKPDDVILQLPVNRQLEHLARRKEEAFGVIKSQLALSGVALASTTLNGVGIFDVAPPATPAKTQQMICGGPWSTKYGDIDFRHSMRALRHAGIVDITITSPGASKVRFTTNADGGCVK